MVITRTLEKRLFSWLRFGQHKTYIATEVMGDWSNGISDFLTYKNGKFFEYEVKRSMSDLYADGNKMKNQNREVRIESDYNHFSPDYFYYVVPADMATSALKYIEEKYPWAGLISYKEFTNNGHEYSSFEFVKRAKRQQTDNKDHELLIKDHIVARMGSIIANLLFKIKE